MPVGLIWTIITHPVVAGVGVIIGVIGDRWHLHRKKER